MSKTSVKGKSKEDIVHENQMNASMSGDQVDMLTSLMKISISSSSNPHALKLKSIMEMYDRTPDLAEEFGGYLKSKAVHYIPVEPALNLLREVTSLKRGLFIQELTFIEEADVHPMMSGPLNMVTLFQEKIM